MYQYRLEKLTRIQGADTLTGIIDLGFHIKTKVTFKLDRVEVPELDLTSDTDPEVATRSAILKWFRGAEKPLYVQFDKDKDGEYSADVFDNAGNVLADDLVRQGLVPGEDPDRVGNDTPPPPVEPEATTSASEIPRTFRNVSPNDDTQVISYGPLTS